MLQTKEKNKVSPNKEKEFVLGVSGHRLERLAENKSFNYETLVSYIEDTILAHKILPDWVLTGMCNGFDLAVVEAVLRINQRGYSVWRPIQLGAYIPFYGQSLGWDEDQRKKYRNLLAQQYFINPGVEVYDQCSRRDAYLRRDKLIVDNSTSMMVYWDGEKTGGTYYTKLYAESVNVPVRNIYELSS